MAPVRAIQFGNEMNDVSERKDIGWSDVASNSSLQSHVKPWTTPFSYRDKKMYHISFC